MITINDLVTEVKYFGAKIGEDFKLIGYVDVKHNDTLVFHANLTQRSMEDVAGLSAEDIQALAQGEADEVIATDEAIKAQNDYVLLVNLGLY